MKYKEKVYILVVFFVTFFGITLSSVALNHAAPLDALKDNMYDNYGVDLTGFIESRAGWRLQDDEYQRDISLAEIRLQLEIGKDLGWGQLTVKGDLAADDVVHETRGELRDLNLLFSPLDIMDVKIGRQVLTWGTGDLLFINDLFPKDWKSFFIGRDDEYLKAPSDAVKMSLFFDAFNLDLVYIPVFNNSEYIDGERISYWNSLLGRTAGRDFIFADEERNRFGNDSEFSARLSRNINSKELALYTYSGFWKTPEGLNGDMITPRLIYPRLTVYGTSLRSALWGGIGNIEIGYYDSRQDRSGEDGLIRNSEFRLLTGFERELGHNLTGAFQYYLEWMEDHNEYSRSLPTGSPEKDERRNVLTLRLTKLLMNQNLRLSLFAYYSPTDKDAYLRPKVHYKISDQWAVDAGGNIFIGSDDYTFFGQFEDNTNAYAGVRYNF